MKAPNRFSGISHEIWPEILGKLRDLQARNPQASEEQLFDVARDWVWANHMADTELFMMRIGLKDPEQEPQQPEDF